MQLTLEEALKKGIEAHKAGRTQEAEQLYAAILNAQPKHPDANHNMGVLAVGMGKLDEALPFFKRALDSNPSIRQYWLSNAEALIKLKRFDEATKNLQIAIKIQPDFLEAHYNLGILQTKNDNLDEAIASYKRAIEIQPNHSAAHYNLGNIYKEKEQYDTALEHYRLAVQAKPDYAMAHNNMGTILKEIGDVTAAIESFERTIDIDGQAVESRCNLAEVLIDNDQLIAAQKIIKTAMTINPSYAPAQQVYSTILMKLCDFRKVIKHSDLALSLGDDASIWASRLFNWIYHPDLSAEEICNEHIRWGEKFSQLGNTSFVDHDKSINRRLKIGYVSPDFRDHSCSFFFEPLFSHHDHTRFELFAYSNVQHEDETTQRFKRYFDTWRSIRNLSDQSAFDMIQKDQIDILIDGCGHMRDTRLHVFAMKPAPVQVTWLGAAWTTGLRQMDYVLFDPHMAPSGTRTSEAVFQLPETWVAYRPGKRAINELVTELPALKNSYVTFGYSGRTERLNYQVFNTWSRLLRKISSARLIMDFKCFSDPETTIYYKDLMEEFGIDTSRVTFRHSSNIFAALGDIDILLDSFPHSGGTMLFDSLWMGVPTITMASRPPVGRIGTSLMMNLNMDEWVVNDEDAYIKKAMSITQALDELALLRSNMRSRMQKSPVMNEGNYATHVEHAYAKMWEDWCKK